MFTLTLPSTTAYSLPLIVTTAAVLFVIIISKLDSISYTEPTSIATVELCLITVNAVKLTAAV